MSFRSWTVACCVCFGFCVSLQPAFAAPLTGGTGPGGIGLTNGTSSLRLWLRGDTLGAVSSNIASWTDSSGSGYTVVQNVAAPQVFQTAAFNGQKAATFATAYPNGELINTAFLDTDFAAQNATMFTVYKNDTFPANAHLGITTTGSPGIASVDLYQGTSSYNGDFRNVRLGGLGLGYPSTGSHLKTVVSSNGAFWRLRSDGTQLHSTTQDWGLNPTFTIGEDTTHGAAQFNGEVAEIAVFNSVLNAAQVQIVENSQSSRYNIGGTGGADKSLTTGDHYNGDTTAKGHFDFDVVGIGRVDAANEHTSGGSGGFGIEAAGALADNTWALAGHDNGSNGVTTVDSPTGLPHWERSFYIDTDGVASANLAFDWNDAGVTSAFDTSFIALYFRSANSGTFSIIAFGTVDTVNQRVDFLNVALDPNDGYFTLGAVPVPEPSTFALLGLGAIGLAVKNRRRRARR